MDRLATKKISRRRVLVIFVLISVVAILNVGAALVFENGGDASVASACFLFSVLGGVVTEEALLAMWAVLGSQALKVRLLICCGLSPTVPMSVAIGMRWLNAEYPMAAFAVLVLAAAFCFGLMLLFMLLTRACSRRVISAETMMKPSGQASQFSLRYILGITAGIAALISVIRFSMPDGRLADLEGVPWSSLMDAAAAAAVYSAFSVILVVSNIWLVLTDERRSLWSGLLTLELILGPIICVRILAAFDAIRIESEMIMLAYVFSYGVGAAVTSWAVLLVLRLSGLRFEPS